jgi:predicted GH43/DUF377 family glycosyl hydrolase
MHITGPSDQPSAVPYTLTRVGLLMAPEPGNPLEAEGVLNPATGRTADGEVMIFPRMVAAGNVSRIGRGQLIVRDGVPSGVHRDGIALAPDRGWERGTAHGGTEDPRITVIEDLGIHVMSYIAFGPFGPRPALAVSTDLQKWERLGPVLFDYDDELDTDLNLFPNKDVVFFPEIVPAPDGTPSFAALHRPMWDFSFTRPEEHPPIPPGLPDARPSIWISYVPATAVRNDLRHLARLGSHRFVAGPAFAWEAVKIGAGPAPIRIPEGWLLIHHGVTGSITGGPFQPQGAVHYAAGAMILDSGDPSRVLGRTPIPLLEPATGDETNGIVANVVFPTAIETIDGVRYVLYGMADTKIGVARLDRTTDQDPA